METAKKATILIVDDDPTNAEMLSEYLEQSALNTAISPNGAHALKQCAQIQPDLILLDVMMPGIDGFETCVRLKQDAATQDIPVIFTTALTDTTSKIRGFEVGGVDYITKPSQPDEVLARVNAHLTIRQQQQLFIRRRVARCNAYIAADAVQQCPPNPPRSAALIW